METETMDAGALVPVDGHSSIGENKKGLSEWCITSFEKNRNCEKWYYFFLINL